MAYNADLTWVDLMNVLGNHARNVMTALREGEAQYNEWQSFRAGRANADIATALSRTSAEVAEMDSAFAAFKMLADCANNQAPVQGSYLYSLRKFS